MVERTTKSHCRLLAAGRKFNSNGIAATRMTRIVLASGSIRKGRASRGPAARECPVRRFEVLRYVRPQSAAEADDGSSNAIAPGLLSARDCAGANVAARWRSERP